MWNNWSSYLAGDGNNYRCGGREKLSLRGSGMNDGRVSLRFVIGITDGLFLLAFFLVSTSRCELFFIGFGCVSDYTIFFL